MFNPSKTRPQNHNFQTLPCGYGSKSWHSGCYTRISGAKLLSSEHGSAWRALPRTQPPRPAPQPLWPGLRRPWRLWKSSSRLARPAALAAQGARVKLRPWPQLVRRKRPCNWWTWAKLVFGMGNLLDMVSWSSLFMMIEKPRWIKNQGARPCPNQVLGKVLGNGTGMQEENQCIYIYRHIG